MTALTGFTVIELANERIAFAGKLLADMGADVILIEPPGGDDGLRLFGGEHAAPHVEADGAGVLQRFLLASTRVHAVVMWRPPSTAVPPSSAPIQ